MRNIHAGIAVAIVLVLTGCAQTPSHSEAGVAPGPTKSFQAFQADQTYCQQFAQAQVGGQAQQANRTTMMGAGVGTLGGAALGAAGGAIGGNAGAGTAIGALTGAVLGTAGGAIMSNRQQAVTQREYDQAYGQCMYSRGNDVQGFPPHVQVASTLSANNPGLVRAVQMQLIRLHYLNPPADGISGPQTISAITQFQQSAGIQPSGEASATLLARLQAAPGG